MKTAACLVYYLLLIACQASIGQVVRVPGTSVSLEPPKGFTASKQFPGFGRDEKSASIMVTELPVAFAKMREDMLSKMKENFAAQQITLLSQEDESKNEPPRLLLHVAQKLTNLEFLKWILITGDTQKTVMVVGTFPKDSDAELGSAVKKSVLTAVFGTATPSNVWEGISFRVTPSDKLKISGKFANAVAFTRSGKMPQRDPNEPLYIVAPIIEGRISDLRIFSEEHIKKIVGTKNVRNLKGKAISINNDRAYELTGGADDAKNGLPLDVYQVVIQGKTQDYLIIGMVGSQQGSVFLPEFRRLTSTFRLIASSKENAVP